MTCQVKVLPSGPSFAVESHETILEAALRQNVGLPYGCRDGACGACKGKVVAGEVEHGGAQEKALSAADKAKLVADAKKAPAFKRTKIAASVRKLSRARGLSVADLKKHYQISGAGSPLAKIRAAAAKAKVALRKPRKN